MDNKITPAKTHEKLTHKGTTKRFSTFDDLAQWAVASGHAPSVQAVRDTPNDLWRSLLFTWYAQGQIGCMFAVIRARAQDEDKWVTLILAGELDADGITGLVDQFASSGVDAIQFLFPGAGDAQQAASILQTLGRHDRWRCFDVGVLPEELDCDTRQVGLRWLSPQDNGTAYESWALGLGDFEPMAQTRRFKGSPFIALVLRPTPPVEARAAAGKGDTGLPAAHVAHMDDRLGKDQVKRDKYTENSKDNKRGMVHPQPMSRARAKVTFSFTTADFEALLGDVPMYKSANDAGGGK